MPPPKGKKEMDTALIDPAMEGSELAELDRIIESASPEQFQQALSLVFRKLMARGLREIPAPKTIKELQAVYDMFRKAEGIEARDKGGGAPATGFLPRVVTRKLKADPEPMEAEVVKKDEEFEI
jgi:hypothetical protein